jgi:hypothetical protein
MHESIEAMCCAVLCTHLCQFLMQFAEEVLDELLSILLGLLLQGHKQKQNTTAAAQSASPTARWCSCSITALANQNSHVPWHKLSQALCRS